jgi:hypothetical protein
MRYILTWLGSLARKSRALPETSQLYVDVRINGQLAGRDELKHRTTYNTPGDSLYAAS